MHTKIVPMDELKILLDKYFNTHEAEDFYPEIMEEWNDANDNGCKYALLTFNEQDEVRWDFLKDVKVCDDPNCLIDHSSETGMSENTFNDILDNS